MQVFHAFLAASEGRASLFGITMYVMVLGLFLSVVVAMSPAHRGPMIPVHDNPLTVELGRLFGQDGPGLPQIGPLTRAQ